MHPTHYGRICPIETPEGPNIGLINSARDLCARQPVRLHRKPLSPRSRRQGDRRGRLSLGDGRRPYAIAQANAELDKNGKFIGDLIIVSQRRRLRHGAPEDIDFIDVSPKQLVSVAAALIPFLENDDANRALMGSNMQRQAVPLIQRDAPLVGTGMEETVARDSGVTIIARRSGIVDQVDATRIVIRATEETDRPQRRASTSTIC